MNNPWKIAFIVLAATIIIAVVALLWALTRPNTSTSSPTTEVESLEGEASFQVSLTKSQLNVMLSDYLDDSVLEVYVEDQLVISGSFEVFGIIVPITTFFEPIVLDNGNVFLSADLIEVGIVQLPVDTVLQLIGASGVLPSCASIDETGTGILVNVGEITNSVGMTFSVKEIELESDSIAVDVFM